MDAIAETPVETPKIRKPTKRINYALAGTLLHSGVTMEQIALQVGAANANSLRAALHRKGVTKRSAQAVTVGKHVTETITAKVATQAAEMLRENLGDQLGAAVAALGGKRIGYRDLANVGQGHAAVLKTLAETHKTLYGGAEMNVLVFGVDSMNGTPARQIEVESQVTPQPVVGDTESPS